MSLNHSIQNKYSAKSHKYSFISTNITEGSLNFTNFTENREEN